jgi:hypothetical protein
MKEKYKNKLNEILRKLESKSSYGNIDIEINEIKNTLKGV